MATQERQKKYDPFGGSDDEQGGGIKRVKVPNAQAALDAIEEAKEEAEALRATKKKKRRSGGCGCFDDWDD